MQDGCAARHALGHAAHQGCFLRARDEPLPRAPRLRIDARSDVVEQFRYVLDFIQDRWQGQSIQKALWVRSQPRDHIGILEQGIGSLGEQLAQQHGLARPAWPGEYNGRETPSCFHEHGSQFAVDVAHGMTLRNLKYNFKILISMMPVPSARSTVPYDLFPGALWPIPPVAWGR